MDMETAAEFSLHPLLNRTELHLNCSAKIKNQGVSQLVFLSILLVGCHCNGDQIQVSCRT